MLFRSRIGLVTLVVLQLIGLNLWALHLRGQANERQQAMATLLRATYPSASTALAPDAEMERQTSVLRSAAGRAGAGDLEPMLQAASVAWPDGVPPVETLRFEPGKLTLSAASMTPAQIDRFRSELRPAGWAVDTSEGRLTISRANAAAL